MLPGEIARIVVITVASGLLMFLGQPQIYNAQIILVDLPLGKTTTQWLETAYIPAASIVFATALFATILWIALTLNAKVQTAQEVLGWQVTWWLIGLIPLVGILVALALYSKGALYSLTVFFILDALLLYWLPTSTSTSGMFKRIPPGGAFFRDLF